MRELNMIKAKGKNLAEKLYEKNPRWELKDIIHKSWKLYNYIYTGKKEAFVEYLQRLCISQEILPEEYELQTILQAKTRKEFRELALAFMCGFITNPQKHKKERR